MNAKLLAKEPRPFAAAKGRCFIDTNVLVYAHANDESLKQSRALMLLGQLYASGRAVVSTQVLQEFCNVGLKKLGLSAAQLQTQLHFLGQLEIALITADMLSQALALQQTHRLSFYDAMIVMAAQASHCTTIYSEDFNAGEVLGGAKVINPFEGLN